MTARRPLFNCIVAPLAAGPMSPADAKSMLDNYRAENRAEALAEAAAELDRIADTVEAGVADHYGPASGIGPGSAEMVREAASTVRSMAGKDIRDATQAPADESTQPADRVVAYRSRGGRILRCLEHAPTDLTHFVPVTSEDLDDGGICTLSDCGRDVLIAPTAAPAPGFFQPSRTYTRGRWSFQCLAVAPRPWDSEIRAVGYLTRSDGTGTTESMSQHTWDHDGWTEAGEPRG